MSMLIAKDIPAGVQQLRCASNVQVLTSCVVSNDPLPTVEQLGLRGAAQKAFHERAASMAVEHFGRRVFIRAVVEVSNFCRENCSYCGMRRDNRALERFRATHEQ